MKKALLLFILMMALCLVFAACSSDPAEPAEDEAAETETEETEDEYASWPEKSITIVCHTESGAVDTMMRQLGAQLEPILGVPVVIENHAGGDGAVAMAYTLGRPADGYTFMSCTSSFTFTFANGEIDYGPDDFKWITTLNGEPSAIAVLADSPLETLDDFVKAMKEDPNQYIIGGYGSAGFQQYMYYKFEQMNDFSTTWVPFKSGGDVPLNLLGGHIDVGVMTPSSGVSQVQSGEIRLLAISLDERSPYFPDVPTFKECGYDLSGQLWRGIIAAADTPQPIIDKMYEAIQEVVASDAWQEYLDNNLQDSSSISGDDFYQTVVDEVADRAEFLKTIDQ